MTNKDEIIKLKNQILQDSKRLQEEKDVIAKYGKLFHPHNLDKLTKDDFKSFLLSKNNRHWDGIHRQGNMITEDMKKLKKALNILLDENVDIKERLNMLFPKNKPSYIKGLGRAIVTPILLVVYPNKYAVYNTKSEAGLKELGLLPNFKGKSFAEKYMHVNSIINDFADEYGLTLWQADEVCGWITLDRIPIGTRETADDTLMELEKENIEDFADFGLEAHLEDFLVANWEKIDIGKKYNILEEDGDLKGQQYIIPNNIGRIDILARSKDQKEWLVIELKKGKSSDAVVGQTLRYIGWVREHLAQSNETVKGLIILGEDNDKLKYSIKTVPDIKLMIYEVNFKLKESK